MNPGIERFDRALADNRAGKLSGVFSVCSAHPLVLEAALRWGRSGSGPVVIESTSNQVDQDGGYTGMTPADFARWVWGRAEALGVPKDRIVLGGDHLGPNVWRSLPQDEAMAKAEVLVRQYVAAGYRKIHLDCSMALAGDGIPPGQPLPDELVAERTARLCSAAEAAVPASERGDLRYVIGTEVPIPGGAQEHEDVLRCTSVEAVQNTIEVAHRTFHAWHLDEAWGRVRAVVVQPGVEFGDDFVIPFRPTDAQALSRFVEQTPGLVFEAHSTDYQSEAHLMDLVKGHFAILKVGPWLTYALRESLFSLAMLEEELVRLGTVAHGSDLRRVVLSAMEREPKYWKNYYSSPFQKIYSFSDRIRYYWSLPDVEAAVEALFRNVDPSGPGESLVSQFFPDLPRKRLRETPFRARDLAQDRVDRVLEIYARACGMP